MNKTSFTPKIIKIWSLN